MKKALSLYIVLFLGLIIQAQEGNKPDTAQLFYRHFTVQDGLPSNEVYYGYQDRNGYVWFCTDNGVSKFDGVQFKNYNTAEGLRSNVIFGCKEDPNGNLWLYSFAGEIYCYRPLIDHFECPRFNDSLVHLLGGRAILDLVFEKDVIYVVTVGAYVKLDLKPGDRANLNLVEGEFQTLSARVLSNGEILVMYSNEENVTRFNFELTVSGSKAKRIIRNIPINGLMHNQFSSLKEGDNLYIVFGENLFTYNFATKQHAIEVLPFAHIPALKKSSIGILSGSYGKGLWCLKQSGDHIVYEQLIRNKNISGCFEDKQGGIWGCSQTDGVYFIPNHTALSFSRNENEASRRVTAMFTKGDSAFYMTYSGALFLVSANGLPVQQRLIEPWQYNMRDMKALNKNEILLFAGRTMNYTISSGKISSIQPYEICDRAEFSTYTIAARRDKLLIRACEGSWPFEKAISDEWKYGKIYSEAQDGNGKMWLGTINDLIYFDTRANAMSEVGRKNGLKKFLVKHMLPIGKDSMMVASNQGVFLIVKDDVKKSITYTEGLSSNNVHTLFIFDGDLWVGTSRGVDRIKNYKNNSNPVVMSVTGLTGVSECPVTHLGCIGNYLVAGTDEGVYLFDRKQPFYKPIRVSPVVSNITINNTIKITNLKDVELKYNENSLDIHFAALNYRNSLFNKYRYRLKISNESHWSYTSQNHVLFPLLSPGNYEFELQAMNPDGSWSAATSIVSFTVDKPFWQTWQFIVLLVITIGCSAYFLFLFRIKQLQEVGDLTSKLSEAKMQALGMQLNPHFVFNALNSVSSLMAKNDAKSTLKLLGKFAKLMRLVFRNSQHAIIPLEDELKALNLYIELETVRLGKDFSCTMDIESINVAECKVPALLLQPFVENAIWHGIGPLKSEGKLQLVFMRIGDTLQIEIIDNGIGRENAAKIKQTNPKRVHSLDIIKERLVLLRSKYNCYTHMEVSDAFEEREYCGTKVLIIIPWLSDNEMRGRDRILKHFMLDDQSAYN
jgi:hypothetical protein